MSQSGNTKSGSSPTPPTVATKFATDVGGPAIPSLNTITFTGAAVVASGHPLQTSGAGSTVTYNAQVASAQASSSLSNAGLASFNGTQFSVDANGFVMFTGSPTPLTLTGASGGPISAVANNFNILGAAVAAAGVPVTTVGTVGTITVDIQRASQQASSSAANAGISSFNSTFFTVDGNGYVSANGSGLGETITGDSGGALSPTAGNWNILGGTTGLTTSGAVSTLTLTGILVLANGGTNANLTASNGGIFYSTATAGAILSGTSTARQMLQSGASAAPAWSTSTWPATTTINQLLYSSSANTVAGLATTNSAVLTTTSAGIPAWVGPLTNGQVVIGSTGAQPVASTITAGTGITITNGAGSITIAANGAVVGETITGDSGGALSPTAGNWNIVGGVVAAGTSPLKTSGSVSTLTINVQKSQAIAAADTTKIGLCNFNSAQFTVDSTGFVSLSSTGPGLTITGNDAVALSPTGNNWNIYGAAAAAGTSPVTTTGSGSTLTTNVQRSQAIASADATKVGLSNFNSAQFTVDGNGFVSIIGGPAITSVAIQTFTTSGTYTPTSGMKYCIIEVLGGGGAGGGAAATGVGQVSVGAGGAAGEYARGVFSAASIGASQSVTIGAYGTAVSGSQGNTGGTTSVGSLITAIGGVGGQASSAGTSATAPGSAGGSGGTGGQFHLTGIYGGAAFTNVSYGVSGVGANSIYGSGGGLTQGHNAGPGATGYGAGGGGAINDASRSALAGGAGSSGLIIITEYIS